MNIESACAAVSRDLPTSTGISRKSTVSIFGCALRPLFYTRTGDSDTDLSNWVMSGVEVRAVQNKTCQNFRAVKKTGWSLTYIYVRVTKLVKSTLLQAQDG